MTEISVIIPIYNVEKYLHECLDSIVNQSFRDIEIICVNDGSTDKSLDILEEYAKRDERIKIINQSNQGLGAARNKGLSVACGNYIYFIDSDDFIDLNTLEKLHDNIVSNRSDVVLFKFQQFDNNHNVHRRGIEFKIDDIFGDIDYSNFTFIYLDAKKHVMNSAFSACLKLYKKEFLNSFDDFYFPEGISFEDIFFHVKVMLRASKISFVPESLYYYRSNEESILNSSANVFDIFKSIDMVDAFLKENDYYSTLENEFIFFKIAQILVYIISADSNDYFNKAKEEFINTEIKDEKSLKKYSLNGYNLVMQSDNYWEYLIKYYKIENSKLKRANDKLSKENKKLEQFNEELMSSKSWKMTKLLRIFSKS